MKPASRALVRKSNTTFGHFLSNHVVNWVLANEKLIQNKVLHFDEPAIQDHCISTINRVFHYYYESVHVLLATDFFKDLIRQEVLIFNPKIKRLYVNERNFAKRPINLETFAKILQYVNVFILNLPGFIILRKLSDRVFSGTFNSQQAFLVVLERLKHKDHCFFEIVDAIEAVSPFLFDWNVVHDHMEKWLLQGKNFAWSLVKSLKEHFSKFEDGYCASVCLEYFELSRNLAYAKGIEAINENVKMMRDQWVSVLSNFITWTEDLEALFSQFGYLAALINHERKY